MGPTSNINKEGRYQGVLLMLKFGIYLVQKYFIPVTSSSLVMQIMGVYI
jgi:hypothetical protein